MPRLDDAAGDAHDFDGPSGLADEAEQDAVPLAHRGAPPQQRVAARLQSPSPAFEARLAQAVGLCGALADEH